MTCSSGSIERSVAVGIPVLHRTTALSNCLESIDGSIIDRVIVADNGHTKDRSHLYDRDWPFELTVLDLEYDVGTGPCRSAISSELKEDYMLVVDCDMIIPPSEDLRKLLQVLESVENIGAVSGILVEGNRIRSGCSNLFEEQLIFGGTALVHSIREDPSVQWVDKGVPVYQFDMLTNASIMRRECIEEYSWDSDLPLNAHLDFFIGHLHKTDWVFGVCPPVVFDHQKGRYPQYRSEIREGQKYQEKKERANRAIKEKWGYDRIEFGSRAEWLDTREGPVLEIGYRSLQRKVSGKYLYPIKDMIESLTLSSR